MCFAQLSHVENHRLGESRQSVFRSVVLAASALFYHVIVVVFVRSKKQVIGSYAGRVVAMMKNFQAIGNWAMRYHPRHSVRAFGPVLNTPNTVAPIIREARPYPAGVSLLNAKPETLRNGRVPMLKLTFTRAVFYARSLQAFITGRAVACYFIVSQGVNLREQVSLRLGSFTVSAVREPFAFYHEKQVAGG